jgi:hypothetical protein
MISPKVRQRLGAVVIATAFTLNMGWAAETRTPAGSSKGTISPAQRPPAPRTGAARGPLPDPTLLDGSKHPAEKKSEYGMIGDFELPGDENARNGRVGGGQQNQGQQQQQQQGAGGMGMPQMGGGPQGEKSAGKSAEQSAAEQQQQANAQGGGPQNPDAAGQQIAGAGDPNAKAEGMQVAQLGGEPSGEQNGGPGEKPPSVAIGDSAMRIPQSQSTAQVVGAQQQANQNTQVYEKGTGTGGKAPTGSQGPNRIEKGRTIPSGL